MCGSMVDIQSATAEIKRGKKEKEMGQYIVSFIHWPIANLH